MTARTAITDLVYTYALNIRTGNGADCAGLFTEDAVFEIRDAPVGSSEPGRTRSTLMGREAIANYVARTGAPGMRVCPLIHNLLIKVNAHEATSSCILTALVWAGGKQIVAEYDDSYRYEAASGWRFTSRISTMLGEFSYMTPQ